MRPGIAPRPHSRSHRRVRLAIAVSGWEVADRLRYDPATARRRSGPPVLRPKPGWAIRRNRSGGPKGPATIVRRGGGRRSFPPGAAPKRRGIPEGKIRAVTGGACFRRVSASGRSLLPSSASASAGGCPSDLPSSRAGRFSVRSEDLLEKRRSGDRKAASNALLTFAFQGLASRSAEAFSLSTR
jgi:hypothetical protein